MGAHHYCEICGQEITEGTRFHCRVRIDHIVMGENSWKREAVTKMACPECGDKLVEFLKKMKKGRV